MAFFNCDKNAAASRANFSARAQCSVNCRAVGPSRTGTKIDNMGGKRDWASRRRRSQKLDRVVGRDSTRRMIRAGAFHQMISGGPIAVTIEQCADDAAIQNSLKSFVFFFRFPFCNHLAVFRKTPDLQSFRIRWAASERSRP